MLGVSGSERGGKHCSRQQFSCYRTKWSMTLICTQILLQLPGDNVDAKKEISPICIYLGRGFFSLRMSGLVRMVDISILFVLLLSEGSQSLGLGDS